MIRVFVCPLLYVGLSDQFLMNHVSGITHQQADGLKNWTVTVPVTTMATGDDIVFYNSISPQ